MDRTEKLGLTIIIVILTLWLIACTHAIEALRKETKKSRADIEELYLRSER